jgi:OTT_1508-like deaminase
VHSGSLAVLNIRCSEVISEKKTSIETWDLVTNVYPKAQPGQPANGKKKIKFTQHCELTLALDMLDRCGQKKISKTKIKIGVSKSCCDWCSEYLNLLSLYSKHPILIRTSHGKQSDGWLLPPGGRNLVSQKMLETIQGRVDEVICKVKSRRRSDSSQLPSLSMEEDAAAALEKIRQRGTQDFALNFFLSKKKSAPAQSYGGGHPKPTLSYLSTSDVNKYNT